MNKLHNDITACIIAGGKSRRFGQDKLLFEYNGVKLIERVTGILRIIFSRIIIVADDKDKFSFLNLDVFPDMITDSGSLGGIYTALNRSDTHKIFCCAGDMPDLNAEFIRYMISESDSHDITIPCVNGMFEGLHAIYTKECISRFRKCILAEKYKISDAISGHNIRTIDNNEIKKFSDPELLFRNINFMNDIG